MENQHKYSYQLRPADVLSRQPVYLCTDGKTKVRPVKGIRITIQIVFYLLLAGIIFTIDFTHQGGYTIREVLEKVGLWLGMFLIYVLIRWGLAKWGCVEPLPEKVISPEEARKAAEEAAHLSEQQKALEAEKAALRAMYQQYEAEAAANEADQTDAVTMAAEQDGEAQVQAVNPTDTPKVYPLKPHWTNYLPGRRVFRSKTQDVYLKLSRQQSTIINAVFLVGFLFLLFRDMTNLRTTWLVLMGKVGILLVAVSIVQAVMIHLYPLELLPKTDPLHPDFKRTK